MLIGSDLISSLYIDIHGADMTIHWENSTIPWRNMDSTTNYVFVLLPHNAPFNSETKQMKRIPDAKYEKSNLEAISEISTHLYLQEINELHTTLNNYESFFGDNLGTWRGKPYDIKLKPDAEPHHGMPFPVPIIHELTFKQ